MIAAAALLLAGTLASLPAPAGDAVVDEVIDLARQRALNGPTVDWPAVEAQARDIAAADPGEAGRTAAIRHVLRALQDGHSFYRPGRAARPLAPWLPVPAQGPVGVLRAPEPIATVVDSEGVGHLVINSWSGGRAEGQAAMRVVREALNRALDKRGCGLIVDVSENHGGDMWPMMGGIAPLYDDGVLQTFETRQGRRNRVNVRGGVLHSNDDPFPAVRDLPPLPRKPAGIAVIVGPRTASSAEILALGFRYQDNARLFGQNTRGATTANSTHVLSNGAVLALATGRIVDRRGVVQEGPLVPDQVTDNPLAAARRWLASRCATQSAPSAGS